MTENIEKKLCLKMFFDEINNVFVFCFEENENSIFQFKMSPKDFENLTGDMVKTVKNYNLHNALEYQEKMKQENTCCQNEQLCNESLCKKSDVQ